MKQAYVLLVAAIGVTAIVLGQVQAAPSSAPRPVTAMFCPPAC